MHVIVSGPHDFRRHAKRRLPAFLFDYLDGGSGAEQTMQTNSDDLAAVAIRQRVLAGCESPDMSTTLFGQSFSMPVGLAPVGLSGMYWRRGERAAVRAAATHQLPYCLSTVSVCPLEEVAEAASGFWFQMYMIRDRGFMRELLSRAGDAGCSALLFTVDMPVPGARYRDARSGLSGPRTGLRRFAQVLTHPRWAVNVGLRGRPHTLGNLAAVLGASSGLEDFIGWLGRNFEPSIGWRDLEWIRETWTGPLIIKGILEPDDARQAAALGADGIVVSNHGGRQLDGAISSARALPAIADAVGGNLKILADSGVRSGTDVLRMLALGADAVLLGRAYMYALATAGQAGVEQLLTYIRGELSAGMILSGAATLKAIDRSLINCHFKYENEGGER